MTILIAPQYADIEGPLIFLAGPIQGSKRWQDDAIRFLGTIAPEINIASPRRADDAYKQRFTEEGFREQVDWELHHLDCAGNHGAVMFWLANEADHKCSRPYAKTSRLEAGKWIDRSVTRNTLTVVGIDTEFQGQNYFNYVIPKYYPDVPICRTLEATCREAVMQIRKRYYGIEE